MEAFICQKLHLLIPDLTASLTWSPWFETWDLSSSCLLLGGIKVHNLNDSTNNSTGMDFQEFKFHSTNYAWVQFHVSFVFTCALNGLLHETSGACIYLVQPLDVRKPIQLWYHGVATASVMWHSFVSHASRRLLQENLPITSLLHLNVSSSFIHPFLDDAIEHWFLNYLCRALDSPFAFVKIIKSFIFVPSPLAVKHTLVLTFSRPVAFIGMSFLPTLSTVVSVTMSTQTGVSSMATITDGTYWCRFFRRQTCMIYDTSLSGRAHGSFVWFVVFLLG